MTDYKIYNNSNKDMTGVTDMVTSLVPFAHRRLGYDRPVVIVFESNYENSQNILGKTAYYNPSQQQITVFVDGRHPKDVLRSLSHELVHHAQNCRGEFDNNKDMGEGYAQVDEHLREMEKQAYLEGNMILRDWEDSIKKENIKMNEQQIRSITRNILKKLNEETNKLTESIEEGEANCEQLHKAMLDAEDMVNRYNQGHGEAHAAREAYMAARCGDAGVPGLGEQKISEEEVVEEGGGGEHGAWTEADKKCSKKGNRNSQEYKDCMKSYDMDESLNETFTSKKDQLLFETLIKKWTK